MPMSQHRPALAAILVAFVAVLTAFATQTASAAPTPSNPIVQRAMLDLGTYQGECWGWMKEVVRDATGSEVGFDYHYGFLEGGAVEVSVSEAGPGDVIQIIDDNWTEPDADYPGMHTAIVIAANGDGSFEIIESNRGFDGMVSLRSGYNPAEISADRGLDFHIYRFGESAGAGRQTDVPTVAGPVSSGDTARINTPGDCLRLRTAPGGTITHCLGHNTRVTITGSPRTVDGTTWVPVETVAGPGWMAASFLLKEAPTASPSAAGDVKPVFSYRSFVSIAAD